MYRSVPLMLLAFLIAGPGVVLGSAAYPTITYQFTGTLDQPIDGTNQVSGSFSWLNTSFHFPGGSYGVESGNDISMTLNMAGHSTTVNVASTFDTHDSGEFVVQPAWSQSKYDTVIVAANTTQNPTDVPFFGNKVALLFRMDDPTGTALTRSDEIYQDLDVSKFANHVFDFSFGLDAQGNSIGGSATITSLQYGDSPPTYTPEPSSLLVFSVGGLAVLVARRGIRGFRSPSRPGA